MLSWLIKYSNVESLEEQKEILDSLYNTIFDYIGGNISYKSILDAVKDKQEIIFRAVGSELPGTVSWEWISSEFDEIMSMLAEQFEEGKKEWHWGEPFERKW